MNRSMLIVVWMLSSAALADEGPPPAPPSSAPLTDSQTVTAPPSADHRSMAIFVQPIAWVFGVYGIGFEVAVAQKVSLAFGANFYAFTVTTSSSSGGGAGAFVSSTTVNVLGALVQPGIAYYLVGRAPSGLWVSPKLELGYVSIGTSSNFTSGTNVSSSSTTTQGFVFGVQGMVGYTHTFDFGLAAQLGVGLGFNYTPLTSSSNSTGGFAPPSQPFSFLGSFGRISVGVGWNF